MMFFPKEWLRSLALALALTMTLACGEPETETQAPPLATEVVLTTFYPTTYWAEFLLDGLVPVRSLLPTEEDPESWQPTREQIAEFHAATLVVLNGAGFEGWVSRSNLAASRIVDTAAAFSAQHLQINAVAHSHGGGGKHVHAQVDGHTWMDPQLAKQQAEALAQALERAFPQYSEPLRSKVADLNSKFDALDAAFTKLSPQLAAHTLFANRSAYDYPAHHYGWKVRNLQLDPSAPKQAWPPFGYSELGPCILLWEQQPDVGAALELAENHLVRSVVFDPCEQPSADGDYFQRMHANLERLEEALQQLADAE